MIDIARDIDSLSNFKRNTVKMVRRIKADGHPMILTVNGKAELVVQDASAYQKLLDAVERLDEIERIREGLADVKAGRAKPMRKAHVEIRKRYALES